MGKIKTGVSSGLRIAQGRVIEMKVWSMKYQKSDMIQFIISLGRVRVQLACYPLSEKISVDKHFGKKITFRQFCLPKSVLYFYISLIFLIFFICFNGTGYVLNNFSRQIISADKIFGIVRDFLHFCPQEFCHYFKYHNSKIFSSGLEPVTGAGWRRTLDARPEHDHHLHLPS